MKRDTRKAYRSRAKATEEMVAAAVESIRSESAEKWRAAREESARREAERHQYTREELLGAKAVQTRTGWYLVKTVNEKSLTIWDEAGTRTIQFAKVLRFVRAEQ